MTRKVKDSKTRLALTVFSIVLIALMVAHSVSPARGDFAGVTSTDPSNKTICNCVVFALDGTQDYWLHSSQLAIMNTFISHNAKLTVGIVAGHTGLDTQIVGKVKEGVSSGLFETALSGWHYLDYTQLTEKAQTASLTEGENKVQTLFGVTPSVFLPPYGSVNEDTLWAMYQTNVSVLAGYSRGALADLWNRGYLVDDSGPFSGLLRSTPIFHFSSINFSDLAITGTDGLTVASKLIEDSVVTNGYAVLLVHPQDVATRNLQTGSLQDNANSSTLANLSGLIDLVRSTGFSTSSFSDLVRNISQPTASWAVAYPILSVVENMTQPLLGGTSPRSVQTASLATSSLGAPDPIDTTGLDQHESLLASIYNNFGKSIYDTAGKDGVSPSALAAILYVESHGVAFGLDGRMTIRFEACTFYNLWGQYHLSEYQSHFQCNSPDDLFRPLNASSFVAYHGDNDNEWAAFELARELNEDAALKSISMGLGQIMGFNYAHIGYGSPQNMFANMSASATSQLDGFFAGLQYINANGLTCVDKLRASDFVGFAACYNGAGRDGVYADQLITALSEYKQLTKNRLYSDSVSLD